jgi:hypothetical protein
MSSHHRARVAFFGRSQPASTVSLIIVISLAIILQGCAARPTVPFAGADPADASSPAPAITRRSTIGPFASLRPVDPTPWSKTSASPSESAQ